MCQAIKKKKERKKNLFYFYFMIFNLIKIDNILILEKYLVSVLFFFLIAINIQK